MGISLSRTVFISVVLALTSSGLAMQPPALRSPTFGSDESAPILHARQLAIASSDDIPSDFRTSPPLEVYANFHTIGLIATLPEEVAASDINTMRSYLNVRGQWRPQHDLVQVGDFPWFATSIFWLQPNGTYQFKVEVVGLNNEVIAVWYGEEATRADPVLHQSSASLYVATNGDDSHPGTKKLPFRTVARGFATITAGQTLFIREGRYKEGQLKLNHDGRPDAPPGTATSEKPSYP